MGRLIRRLLSLLCIGAIGATSFGLAYFYFDDAKEKINTQNNLKVDDIEENYRFNKKTNTDKTYTIYFFPSAAYMSLYYKYLTNSTDITPENQFGYKEVQYNETGNILLDSNGNARYKLSAETGEYASFTRSTYNVSYDGAFRKYIGDEFPCDDFEADGGTAYASSGAYMLSQDKLPTNDQNTKRTWGVPGEEFTIYDSTEKNLENYNGHNQYSLDRLGCWDDCYYYGNTISDGDGDKAPTGLIEGDYPSLSSSMDDTNTGRYLPIKLTVTNAMSSSMMEKAVQDIFSSMGNANDLHNYSFTQWTYVDTSEDTPSYPYGVSSDGLTTNTEYKAKHSSKDYPVGDAFQPIPTNRYFDMLSDLSQYADDNGVIRLFPLFSNGKKTTATSFVNGGGAAQKLQITYGSDDDSTSDYKYPFFNSDIYNGASYTDTTDTSTDTSTDSSTDSDDTTDTDTSTSSTTIDCFTYEDADGNSVQEELLLSKYIRLFSYNNIKITSSQNITSMQFTANNIWATPHKWQTDESTKELIWKTLYSLDTDYIQNQLISKYGEGLYTFYVFVANYSYENGPGPSSSNTVSDLIGTFDSFYNNVVSQAMEGKFASLTNKNLIQITDTSNYYNDYKCSPTVVAFEKVAEPKVINDFPVTESTDGVTVSNVDSYISSKYEYAANFSTNSNPLFVGEKNGSSYSINGDDISSEAPYTYIATNIDFMNDDSLYFVIGFASNYSSFHTFSSDGSQRYSYLISDPTKNDDGSYTINPENVFSDAYEFIEEVTAKDSSGNSYQMFKFKSSEYLGIYDIMIQYNQKTGYYDLYMFRHSNLFCYVFDAPLDDYEAGKFVNHEFDSNYQNTKSDKTTANLLFENRYFIGESIKNSDKSSSVNSGNTLDECLRLKIGRSITYSGDDLLNYTVVDRVTDTVVCKYVKNSDGTYTLECNLRIYKNYIFYLKNNATTTTD